jgi:NAD(P)-dependent dehydrogenase (short-subunit alcohol dehydrogenase family)
VNKMATRVQDRVVQITGAASGFGALAAREFAREGARLLLSDINREALEAVTDDLRAAGHEVISETLDVTDDGAMQAHVAQAVGRWGRLDVALNNAGIAAGLKRLPDIPVDEYDRIMAVNAKGVFIGMRHQIPAMLASGGGAILNTSSAAGLVGAGQLSAYAASKHAVVGLTRAAADELATRGIRVNAICPSFAATPMGNAMGEELMSRHGIAPEDARARVTARIPMRRMGTPEEIVQAMLWLCAPENSFLTGQAIAVDGGLTAV